MSHTSSARPLNQKHQWHTHMQRSRAVGPIPGKFLVGLFIDIVLRFALLKSLSHPLARTMARTRPKQVKWEEPACRNFAEAKLNDYRPVCTTRGWVYQDGGKPETL